MDKKTNLKAEVQDLTWALVDDQATEDQVRRLTELLLKSPEARKTYVMCMQMHADLHYLLSGQQSRLAETIEELIKSDKAAKPAKGKKPAKEAKPTSMPLPLSDLPSGASGVPHSNGLSH